MPHRLGQAPGDGGGGDPERKQNEERHDERRRSVFGDNAGDERPEPEPGKGGARAQARSFASTIAELSQPGGAGARRKRDAEPA